MDVTASIVREWCRQVEEQNILTGFLNDTQKIAFQFVQNEKRNEKREMMKGFRDYIESLFDVWLAIEAPDIWKSERDSEARAKNQNGEDPAVILADDFEALKQQMIAIEEKSFSDRMML